jgi:glycosyltransferase involved in cell wall biosynthesis
VWTQGGERTNDHIQFVLCEKMCLNILMTIPSIASRHGGPSKAAIEMARALVERGHKVDIFTTDQDGPGSRLDVPLGKPVLRSGVSIYYFWAETLGLWPGVSYGFWRAIKERVAEYDVVHSHSLWLFSGLVIGHYCRKHNVPYLIRPCGALDPYLFRRHRLRKKLLEWLYERRNFRHAEAIHFTTQEEMDLARHALPFRKGVVVPLGVRPDEFDRLPLVGSFRRAFSEIGQKRIILFLSRLNFKKGLDLLIPALAKVAANNDDVHLVLAGPDEGGFAKKVMSWVDQFGLAEKVTLTGMLQGDQKLAAFRDAEMFVLPSYSENFGIAVVEAMACGLPVVISDKVNIWREVESARAGLVTKCNVDEIARAISILLQNSEKGKEMGSNGRQLVQERFSWCQTAELLEQVYRTVIPGRRHN